MATAEGAPHAQISTAGEAEPEVQRATVEVEEARPQVPAPVLTHVEIRQEQGHLDLLPRRGRKAAFAPDMHPQLAPHVTHEEFKYVMRKCSWHVEKESQKNKMGCGACCAVILLFILFVVTMSVLHDREHTVCVATEGACPMSDGTGAAASCCRWWCCDPAFNGGNSSSAPAGACVRYPAQSLLQPAETCYCRELNGRRVCGLVRLEGQQAFVPERNAWARTVLTVVISCIAVFFLLEVLFSMFSVMYVHHGVNESLEELRKKGVSCEYHGPGTGLKSCFSRHAAKKPCIRVYLPAPESAGNVVIGNERQDEMTEEVVV